MSEAGLIQILEGALMAAGEPLSLLRLAQLFEDTERPSNDDIRAALAEVTERCDGRGFELIQVASGYRFQVRQNLAPWVGRLWQERPQKYSRALLETLSLIAYRQPITRGEIEEVRGVAVSSNIIKMLQEREWVRIVGHRDVPGRPAMYATTRQFLDYFNLKSLEDLPPLAEIKDLDNLSGNLPLEEMIEDIVDASALSKSTVSQAGEDLAADAYDYTDTDTDTEYIGKKAAGDSGAISAIGDLEVAADAQIQDFERGDDASVEVTTVDPAVTLKNEPEFDDHGDDFTHTTDIPDQANAEEAPAEEFLSERSEKESR